MTESNELPVCKTCNQVHTRCSGHKKRKNTEDGKWTPCMSFPLKGRKGCKFHRDLVNVGTNNGRFVHGRYSKFATVGIDKRLEELHESRREGEHLSLRDQIDLAEVRISQLVGQLDTSASDQTWKDIRQSRADITASIKTGNTEQLSAALKVLDQVSERGILEHRAWDELFRVQRQLKSLIESERKKMIEDKFMLSLDEVSIILSMIGHAINQKVPDVETRKALAQEIMVISAKAGFEIQQ